MAQWVKESACSAGDTGDMGPIPGLGRSPGEGNGNLFQYSCLEDPMDRGAWWTTVHGVPKSRTGLSDFTSLKIYTIRISEIEILEKLNFLQTCPEVLLNSVKENSHLIKGLEGRLHSGGYWDEVF